MAVFPPWVFPTAESGMFTSEQFGPSVWIHIPGPVVSKANHRRATSTSHAAKWSKVRAYEQEVSFLLYRAKPSLWAPPGDSVASSPPVVAVICACTIMDAGNISKSLLDAAAPAMYASDASVVAVSQVVYRGRTNQSTLFALAQLTPDHKVAPAISALLDNTLALLIPPNSV